MNAEGQLDTDEDLDEEAEGIPEGVVINNDYDAGSINEDEQVPEGLGALAINDIQENILHDEDYQRDDSEPNNNADLNPAEIEQEHNEILNRGADLQQIHPAFAPIVPPAAPIRLRCSSTSSLDESSQRASCKRGDDLCTDHVGSLNSAPGHRPSYQNHNHAHRVLERFKELRNNNELCDVTLVSGGHEVRY